MISVGEHIKELRAKKGYSQEQFAELSNLNRVTIAKYEAGKIEPGAQALCRMADAFDISVDELLGRKEIEPININNLNDSLIEMLITLSPSEVQRVQDFVSGMKSADRV